MIVMRKMTAMMMKRLNNTLRIGRGNLLTPHKHSRQDMQESSQEGKCDTFTLISNLSHPTGGVEWSGRSKSSEHDVI